MHEVLNWLVSLVSYGEPDFLVDICLRREYNKIKIIIPLYISVA